LFFVRKSKFALRHLPIVRPLFNLSIILYFEEGKQGNTLNYFAEAIANRALLLSLGFKDDRKAFEQLITEITEVASWILEVSDVIMSGFILRHKDGIIEGGITEVYFDKLPTSKSIKIPWFTDNTAS
jgi:hypothetical protein